MLNVFIDKIGEAVTELREESRRRREITPSDVSTEILEFAAKRVERAIAEATAATETLTPAQYGELHGRVTPQTVTRWIRTGELAAQLTASGYRIPRDSVRVARVGHSRLRHAS